MMRNRWLRCLCVFLSVSFVFTLAPSRLSADDDIANCYSVSENLEYDVDVSIVSSWDTYANLEFAFTNTGTETIHNWYFTFDLPYVVEGIWNAYIFETVNGVYTIKNAGWNQDILPKSTVYFGMTVSSLNGQQIDNLPSFYLLNTIKKTVDLSCYTLSYQEYSNWGTGFNGALILSNNSVNDIEDWTLSFSSNCEIFEVSGGNLINNNLSYTISNDGSTQNIAIGSSVNMTITGNSPNSPNVFEISNETLFSIVCSYRLNEDTNINGVADYRDFINSVSGHDSPTPIPTATPTTSPAPTNSETPTPTTTLIPTTTANPTPVPTIDPYDFVDSDGDGLLDSEELSIGTDPNSIDTDGDGITDFTEITMNYNPCVLDSERDGVSDGDKDFDLDGISNSSEIQHGTCPYLIDSDMDRLSDYEEINRYGSDPNNSDTDDDGLLDGDEVFLGLDPTNVDSDGNGIQDDSEKFNQTKEIVLSDDSSVISKISIDLTGTGYIESALEVTEMDNKDVYTCEISGLVGNPFNFEYHGVIEEVTLAFSYDETKLNGIDEEDLCLVWYDETNCEYILLNDKQEINSTDNTISITTTHFSTYFLVSKSEWLHQWKESLDKAVSAQKRYDYLNKPSSNTQYLVAIQLEYTDSSSLRSLEELIYSRITQQLNDENYGGLLLFSGECIAHGAWNKQGYDETAYDYIQHYALDYEDYPDFIQLFSSASDVQVACNSSNIVLYVITSESEIHINDAAWDEINRNGAYDIRIISTESYVNISNSKSIEIDSICQDGESDSFLSRISQSILPNTDKDRFTDYQESSGFVLSNGTYVTTNPKKGDTDDDSISDGEEIGNSVFLLDMQLANDPDFRALFYQYAGIVDSWSYFSNPAEPDSDFDTVPDSEDAIPLTVNPDIIYVMAGPDPNFVNQGTALETEYTNMGLKVERMDFTDINSFLSNWEKIGCLEENGVLKYGNKYFYNVRNVVISHHGSSECVVINDSQLLLMNGSPNTNTIVVSQLSNKRIQSLNLYACSCGQKENDASTNIAETFLSLSNIKQVVAFDTTLWGRSTKNGTSFSYWGWTYSEKPEVDDDQFRFISSVYAEDGVLISPGTASVFLIDNSCVKGFRCFKRNGNSIVNFDILSNDIRYGKLYYNDKYDPLTNTSTRSHFFLYDDLFSFDFSETHDPLLSGY